ncbi:hypothetical protein NDU88_002819 [Pleurodeles waltl]|uniref:Uncharacterized protein n=1 Tax=Pleurodeles waltl TaxID=8319 RepID=A0AAV7T4Q8_PLEWA|nr:hypothetical protein NDU88_002819 [Pleurodeles waltl]
MRSATFDAKVGGNSIEEQDSGVITKTSRVIEPAMDIEQLRMGEAGDAPLEGDAPKKNAMNFKSLVEDGISAIVGLTQNINNEEQILYNKLNREAAMMPEIGKHLQEEASLGSICRTIRIKSWAWQEESPPVSKQAAPANRRRFQEDPPQGTYN